MKVLIVGAGGIGSWLVHELLQDEIKRTQLPGVHFTVADDDHVEQRNVLYQNFDQDQARIMQPKVEALAELYDIDEIIQDRIEDPAQLQGYDVVISCVDNVQFRRMLFANQEQVPYWIDLRAEGRVAMIYNKADAHTTEWMNSVTKEPKNPENANRGCALPGDLAQGRLQYGNRFAALMGAQALLNHVREVRAVYREFLRI